MTHHKGISTGLATLLMVNAALLLTACEPKGAGPTVDPIPAAHWPFIAVAARFHHFTAFKAIAPPQHMPEGEGGGYAIDARVMLLDQFDDATKGVGDLRLELYRVREKASAAAWRELLIE